jgi:hypothetical protein
MFIGGIAIVRKLAAGVGTEKRRCTQMPGATRFDVDSS